MKIRKILFLLMVLSTAGCSLSLPKGPKVGDVVQDRLNEQAWPRRIQYGDGLWFVYVGDIDEEQVFKCAGRECPIADYPDGIIVKDGKVLKSLNVSEMTRYDNSIREKIALDEALAREKIAREEALAKEERVREEALAREKKVREEVLAREKQILLDNKRFGVTGVGLDLRIIDFINHIHVFGDIRNNLEHEISDVKIRCSHYGQSGTDITRVFDVMGETIYQTWKPGEIREVSFNISDVNQRHRTECKVTGWKH